MANLAKLNFTAHALMALSTRQLEREWVERTLAEPDWWASDPQPDRMRAFKAIPERENRTLRVVYTHTGKEIRVITAFFDRDAKRP
jgi:hypothetical protein